MREFEDLKGLATTPCLVVVVEEVAWLERSDRGPREGNAWSM